MDRLDDGAGAVRKASIKETGEELSQEDWARFDAAIAEVKAERERALRQANAIWVESVPERF